MKRRNFLQTASGLGAALTAFSPTAFAHQSETSPSLRPPRLRPDATIGLVTPASQVSASEVDDSVDKLTQMGLRVKLGKHVLDQYGYLAGQDFDRAEDINAMFADPEVDAIIATRGGWGCARMLEYLDYNLIRQNPKIVMGYSDITALLIALYAKTGLVTFHGPVGIATWNAFTKDALNRVVFENTPTTLTNFDQNNNLLTKVKTIRSGEAEGILIGGNLSVLCGMVGSPYVPERWDDKILFLEEIEEEAYRVDRMLTHLRIAGILGKVRGVIFGDCRGCAPKSSPSLSLNDVLWDHLSGLGIPVWYGSMIGHIPNKFTVPLGVRARINALEGSIQLLEPAVS